MTAMTLEGKLGPTVTIDACTSCQAFWFDQYESLHLAPSGTLQLMKLIGEHSSAARPTLPDTMRCPRCPVRLTQAHDMARNMRFSYWKCGNEHGRFIGFFEFLKEKNFIHPLSPEQIAQLRQNIQFLNCSNCGASIDLQSNSACPFCRSPISMLDMQQPQQMLAELKQAAAARPIDPALPAKLVMAKLEAQTAFVPFERDQKWWSDSGTSDLVQAGLNAVAGWIISEL